jgi:DNA-binding XRE family transcriptional regulator
MAGPSLMFNEKAFRVALAELNKTQKQIARECGINENTIPRIKKGMDVKVSLAIKIARAVNLKVEDLWRPGE